MLPHSEERVMEVTTIGLDIAKSVFQVHGVDANGQVIVRRQIKRRYVLAFFQKRRADDLVSPALWIADHGARPTTNFVVWRHS